MSLSAQERVDLEEGQPSGKADEEILNRSIDESSSGAFENKSNKYILRMTSALFFIFVIAELIGALASNSLSLMADAASMSVDVFSYLTNMYAEHVKSKGEVLSENMKLVLAAGIPTFSLMCLVAVTVWIIIESLKIIMNPPESESVDTLVMWGFASVNLLIDVVCIILFYYNLESALFYDTKLLATMTEPTGSRNVSTNGSESGNPLESQETESTCLANICGGGTTPTETSSLVAKKPNLNMLAAFYHVGADLLRTMAVFVGAAASTFGINADLADAWAAIICSATIFVTIIPLVGEIITVVRAHIRANQ